MELNGVEHDNNIPSKKQARVILWAMPRSISTAFFRSIMQRGNVTAILEPLEQPYAEKPFVFVKDMAYYLQNRLTDLSALPSGYQHTFLIREPTKAVKSLYKMSIASNITGWNYFEPDECGFEDLWKLFQLVANDRTGKVDRSSFINGYPTVIDASDLLEHPVEVMSQYCSRIGVSFDQSMLCWDDKPLEMPVFRQWLPWFEGALTSHGFVKPTSKGRLRRKSSEDLPHWVVRHIVDKCEPFYKNFYRYKITVDN